MKKKRLVFTSFQLKAYSPREIVRNGSYHQYFRECRDRSFLCGDQDYLSSICSTPSGRRFVCCQSCATYNENHLPFLGHEMGADETFVDPFEEVAPPETEDPDVTTEYNENNDNSINSSHRLSMRLPINASSKLPSPKESWQSFQQFFEGDSDEKILTALETLLEMRKEGDVVTPFDDLLQELEEEEEEANGEIGTGVNAAVFESSGESEEREDSDLDSINLFSKTFVDTLTTYPPIEETIALSTATKYAPEEETRQVEGRNPFPTTGDPSTLPSTSDATTAPTALLPTTADRSTRGSTLHIIEEKSHLTTAKTETTLPSITSPTYATESVRALFTYSDYSGSDNTVANPEDFSLSKIPPQQSSLPTTTHLMKEESSVELPIPSVEPSSTEINKKTSFWDFVTVDERLNANGRTEVDEMDGSGSDLIADIITESMETESLQPIIATSTAASKPQTTFATIEDNQNGYSAYDFFDMYDVHVEFSTPSSTPTMHETSSDATTTTTKRTTTTQIPTLTTNFDPSWPANPQPTKHTLETNSDASTTPKNHLPWNEENEVTFDKTRSPSRGFKIIYGGSNRRNAMSFAISSDSSSYSEHDSSTPLSYSSSAPSSSSTPFSLYLSSAPTSSSTPLSSSSSIPLSSSSSTPLSSSTPSASYSSSAVTSSPLSPYSSSSPTSYPSSNSKRKQRKSRKHKKNKRRKKARRKERDRVKQKLYQKLSFKDFLLGPINLSYSHNSALDEKPKTFNNPSDGSIPSTITATRQSSKNQLVTFRRQGVTSTVTSPPATATPATKTLYVTAAPAIPHDKTALNYVTNARDPPASSKSATETTTFPTRKSWRSWTRRSTNPVMYYSSSIQTTASTTPYSTTAPYKSWMTPPPVASFNVILGGDATIPPTPFKPAIPPVNQPRFLAARGKPVEFAGPSNKQTNNLHSMSYLSKSRTSFRQSLIEIPSRQKKRAQTLTIGERAKGASETNGGSRKQGFASDNNLEQWLVKVPGRI